MRLHARPAQRQAPEGGASAVPSVYSAYDHCPEPAWVIRDDLIVHANAAARALWGDTSRPIAGGRWTSLHPAADAASILRCQEEARASGSAHRMGHLLGRDGAPRAMEFSLALLPDGALLVLGHDVGHWADRHAGLRTASEQYLRLFESANDVLFVHDMHGVLTEVNRGACKVTGYRRDELVGMPAQRLLTPESLARAKEALRRLGAGDAVPPYELTVRRRDGSQLTLEVSAWLLSHQGAPWAVQGIGRDLTARRATELALRDSEARLRTIVEHSPDAITSIDADGIVTFSRQAGAIGGALLPAASSCPFHQQVRKALDDVYRRGELAAFETPFATAAGRRWFATRLAPIFRDGEIVGATLIQRDISGDKRKEDALILAREESDALAAVARDVTGHLEPDEVFQELAEAARRLSQSDVAGVALRQGNAFRLVAESGMRRGPHRGLPMPVPPEAALVGALREAEPPAMLETVEALDREGIVALCSVPVRLGAETMALICVGSRAPRQYSAAQQTLLERLADLSAAAVRNSWLYSELERSNRDLERAAIEARRLADRADEGARMKAEFLATMSHEIRTPLTGLIGMLDHLQQTSLTDQQEEFARVAHNSAQILLQLINDVLDLSKLEAGKVGSDVTAFDLREVVESTADVLAVAAREKGLRLIVDVDPALPERTLGDPGRLRQVLLNLVGNAVKFTDRGHVLVRLTVEDGANETLRSRITITDTGIGIAPAARRRLFQPFTQADGSTSRRYGGTGLGLAICKRLVDLMGGTIGVDSSEGEGSTFWFELPFHREQPERRQRPALAGRRILVAVGHALSQQAIARQLHGEGASVDCVALLDDIGLAAAPYDGAVIAADGDADLDRVLATAADLAPGGPILVIMRDAGVETRRRVEAAGLRAATQPLRRETLLDALLGEDPAPSPQVQPEAPAFAARVLIADDDPVNRQVLGLYLQRQGISAHPVGDGRAAAEAALRLPYDIIFMDCQMPGLDGMGATRLIRKTERGRRTPVIAITAHTTAEVEAECRDAGMDDVLTKPVQPEHLKAVLSRWLRSVPQGAAPIAPALSGAAQLDMAHLNGLRDLARTDPTLIDEVVGAFAAQAPELLAQAFASLERGDAQGLLHAAHTLKGSAANLGALELAALAAEVERLAGDGLASDPRPLLARLQQCIANVTEALRQWAQAA